VTIKEKEAKGFGEEEGGSMMVSDDELKTIKRGSFTMLCAAKRGEKAFSNPDSKESKMKKDFLEHISNFHILYLPDGYATAGYFKHSGEVV
jgi:hypothetical protein